MMGKPNQIMKETKSPKALVVYGNGQSRRVQVEEQHLERSRDSHVFSYKGREDRMNKDPDIRVHLGIEECDTFRFHLVKPKEGYQLECWKHWFFFSTKNSKPDLPWKRNTKAGYLLSRLIHKMN